MRENVELYGAVLGYPRRDGARRVDEAIAFAGLERFRDAKLKSLSSGMRGAPRLLHRAARRADILLLDEILAVGDADFQRKCLDVFEGLKRQRQDDRAGQPRPRPGAALLRARVLARQGPDRRRRASPTRSIQTLSGGDAGGGGCGASPLESDAEPSIAGATAAALHRRRADGRASGRAAMQVTPWTRARGARHRSSPRPRWRDAGVRVMVIGSAASWSTRPTPACSGCETGRLVPGDRRSRSTSASPPRCQRALHACTLAAADELDGRGVTTGSTTPPLPGRTAARCADGVADLGAEYRLATEARGRAERPCRARGRRAHDRSTRRRCRASR